MIISQLFFLFVLSFTIAYFLGSKRQIGVWWSFFFCIFLNIIGGFIIVMLSRKHYDPNPTPSKLKLIIGWTLAALFGLIALITIFAIFSDFASFMKARQMQRIIAFNQILMTIGLSGLGFYLVGLAKGKNFNSTQSPIINE